MTLTAASLVASPVVATNSIGDLGGFVGPYVIGKAKDMTGSGAGGLTFLAVLLFGSFIIMAPMRLGSGRDAVIATRTTADTPAT